MSSELRSETARLNGAKSKGPTTAAGIEKSSQNATKHGRTSGSAIVLAYEIRADFDDILNNFIEIYLHLTSRYESRLHRIYDHAYATLRELQQAREQLPPAAPAATLENQPTSSPEPEIAKRTQGGR